MNVGGNHVFSSGMNAIGGSGQGLSSNLANVGNRNSAPGLTASSVLGNLGPRITNSVGNMVGGSSIGRSISSAGLSMPGIASRINSSGNSGSGALNIPGSNRMSSMHQGTWLNFNIYLFSSTFCASLVNLFSISFLLAE
jgi:CCR4-NOT transcription complex subunit 2